MIGKYIVPALAASNLLGVEASSRHRHLHKKELVYAATEVEVTTEYVTVTVTEGDETETSVLPTTVTESSVFAAAATTTSSSTTSTSTSSSIAVVSSTSTTPVAPSTTLSTIVTSTSSSISTTSAVPVPTTSSTSAEGLNINLGLGLTLGGGSSSTSTSSAAAAATSSSSSSSSSSGSKRGIAYNTASLVSSILSVGSGNFGWCYDWGFDSSGLTADLQFIPMLWSPAHYTSTWDTKAEAAISSGVDALFSFNECDNSGQCNMDAADAATYHIKYLNPYEGKIKIGAPAISSSETTGQGLDWLSSFISACAGNCAMDFVNLHWYGPGGGEGEGGDTFLQYLEKAYNQTQKPIWVTEFQATSGDEDAFVTYVLPKLDALSYVEGYSYFYVDTLFSGTALTAVGELYATLS